MAGFGLPVFGRQCLVIQPNRRDLIEATDSKFMRTCLTANYNANAEWATSTAHFVPTYVHKRTTALHMKNETQQRPAAPRFYMGEGPRAWGNYWLAETISLTINGSWLAAVFRSFHIQALFLLEQGWPWCQIEQPSVLHMPHRQRFWCYAYWRPAIKKAIQSIVFRHLMHNSSP